MLERSIPDIAFACTTFDLKPLVDVWCEEGRTYLNKHGAKSYRFI